MAKMKAAVLYGVDDLRYVDYDIPAVGADDVLVKVTACGICGSDIPRVLTTGTYHFPTIPGHEFGGEIVECGANVNPELVGKRVAVIPMIPCKKCPQCEVGNFQMCEKYDYLGSRNDGGFAQYCLVPSRNFVLVPDEVTDDQAAMLEPITVAQHVVSNNGVHFGDDVAVYGLGAIGIFIAQWAKAMGAEHVFAIDLDEKKVEIAKNLGLVDAICTKYEDAHAIINEKTKGKGVDICFEATGSGYVFNEAMGLIKKNGCLGLVGRPTRDFEMKVDSFEKLLRKQITVKGTWAFEMINFPHNPWDISLAALRDGKIKTDGIMSHFLPLSKTYEGIHIMAERKEFFHKIIVKPQMEDTNE